MYYSHNFYQSSLFSFQTYGFQIGDDPLVLIAKEIDWDSLIKEVIPLFAKEGRNSKSIRMMLGLEMAKTYFNGISDKRMVGKLKTDTAVMYFCGFDKPIDKKEVPDSSSMTKFRNKLTKEVINNMNLKVTKEIICKLPPRKRTQVGSDTTCLPANITYPTDSKVLTQTAKKLIKVVDGLRQEGEKIIIRGKRNIIHKIQTFNKIRRKTKVQIRRIKRELLTFNRRIIRTIKKSKNKLNEKAKETVKIARQIIRQQIEMYKNRTNRIPLLSQKKLINLQEKDLRNKKREVKIVCVDKILKTSPCIILRQFFTKR